MNRVSTWETALSDYINAKRDTPFEYGVNDCCLFVGGAVEAMTGHNPMQEFIGQYDSLKTSLATIKAAGGTLEQCLDDRFTAIPIGMAQRGDIAFFDNSIGIVAESFAWFVSDDGLERVYRQYWDKAWSVGRG